MFRCQSAAWSLGRSGGDLVELVMQGRTFCGRCATTGRTTLVGCHGEIGIDRGPPLRARLPSSPVDKRERWGCPYEVMVVVFRAVPPASAQTSSARATPEHVRSAPRPAGSTRQERRLARAGGQSAE